MQITLKAARVNAGLTQPEAAKALGKSIRTLVCYEKGKTYPNTECVAKMLKLYNVTIDDVIFLPNTTI